MQEVKIELGNEEIDRGGKVVVMVSFRISIKVTSIVDDGYSREFSCLTSCYASNIS